MAKRLQVILQDPDYREVQRMARSRHMSLAEWVRQALDLARRREPLGDDHTEGDNGGPEPLLTEPLGDAGKKLEVIRAAAQHDYPTADIDTMMAEIEQGYRTGVHS